jgi:hypothetical protein
MLPDYSDVIGIISKIEFAYWDVEHIGNKKLNIYMTDIHESYAPIEYTVNGLKVLDSSEYYRKIYKLIRDNTEDRKEFLAYKLKGNQSG